ncbi:hypothetical protein Q9R34_19480 [Enterobacter sp. BRE11]|nr:hypothetical protein [Enterobacter sp. BRE11]
MKKYQSKAHRNGQQHNASVTGYAQRHAEQAERKRQEAVQRAQIIIQAAERKAMQRQQEREKGWLRRVWAAKSGVLFGAGALSAFIAVGLWFMNQDGYVYTKGNRVSMAGQGLLIIAIAVGTPLFLWWGQWRDRRDEQRRVEKAKAFLEQQEKIQAFKRSQLGQQ